MKKYVGIADAIPSKRLYLSIISDYDLHKSICELIDNALDIWKLSNMSDSQHVSINIQLDVEQQTIYVQDNAGGIPQKDLSLIVSPGRTSNEPNHEIIGIFGVGSKRAVVALAQDIKIYSREAQKKTYLIEFDNEWIQDDEEWNLPIYQTDNIEESTTIIKLSSLRKTISEEDVFLLNKHLEATYGKFLNNKNVSISLNEFTVKSREFENWAFPPEYQPTTYRGEIKVKDEAKGIVKVRITGGLVGRGEPSGGEFGVYFYCNKRLIARGLKSYEIGFSPGKAGNPSHLNLVRVIVYLNGGAKLMPWNSSKSDIDTKHKIFLEIREIIIQLVTYYASLSRRFEDSWEENVFQYQKGTVLEKRIDDFSKTISLRLPSLPRVRKSYEEHIKQLNKEIAKTKIWTIGLYESIIAIDKISKLNLSQGGRIILLLLDSTIEIAFKEYLVNEINNYSDSRLKSLFSNRLEVHKEISQKIQLTDEEWSIINYFYNQRCDLVHRKATSNINVEELKEYQKVVESVLKKMFGIKFIE